MEFFIDVKKTSKVLDVLERGIIKKKSKYEENQRKTAKIKAKLALIEYHKSVVSELLVIQRHLIERLREYKTLCHVCKDSIRIDYKGQIKRFKPLYMYYEHKIKNTKLCYKDFIYYINRKV